MKNLFFSFFISALLVSCGQPKPKEISAEETREEAQKYLEDYGTQFQNLYRAASEAEWKLNTMIMEGDTLSGKAAEEANEALAKFTGSKENIEKCKAYIAMADKLLPIQVKQLKAMLYAAGGNPQTVADIVKEKIKADTEQTKKLFGFNFQIKGKAVTTNDIDKILKESTNLQERLEAWEASKEVGKDLKTGLEQLQHLRNKSVQALGFQDFFDYQVSEYGMTKEELMKVCSDMTNDIWPLYRELHTWARYELAKKYNQPVPEMLPAHWIPNRWGQEWTPMIDVKGMDVDAELKKKSAEWIVKEAENFYVSLGFEALPQSFYEKSSLYPLQKDAPYKKNNHASAWHIDLDKDVRSLMSVEPNAEWWETTLHELGHIYYYISYTNPDVPVVLRAGANRAYHEAMGSLIGMASMKKPFLQSKGLLPRDLKTDKDQEMQTLMKEALNYIVVIPWGAGVMTEFEHDLYAKNLPVNEYNKRWWELVKKYQGIAPPSERGEEFCDAASKTHINNDPAQYYDYAMSFVLLFQLHDHIAKNILKQDPHATNYGGSKEVGDFFKALMQPGASVDWREHLKKHIGSDMSAKAMVDYFSPLMEYLKEVNKGRSHTLPEML